MNYFDIFLESAWTASIIPFGNEPTFYALKFFGGHNMAVPFILAVSGATIGQCFNWLAGKALVKYLPTPSIFPTRYPRLASLFNRYGIFFLLISWLQLCKMFSVLVGCTKARFRVVFLLILIGQIFNYGRIFLS